MPEKPQSVEGCRAIGTAESADVEPTTSENVEMRDGIHRQGKRAYRPWRELLLKPQGAGGPMSMPAEELDAVLKWLDEVAESIDDPSPVDLSLLGSLGRVMILELRLSRAIFRRGLLDKKGNAKAALTELRATQILKLKILGRLPLRSKARPDVEPLTFVDHDAVEGES